MDKYCKTNALQNKTQIHAETLRYCKHQKDVYVTSHVSTETRRISEVCRGCYVLHVSLTHTQSGFRRAPHHHVRWVPTHPICTYSVRFLKLLISRNTGSAAKIRYASFHVMMLERALAT